MTDNAKLVEALKSRPVGPVFTKNADPEKDFFKQVEVTDKTANVVIRDEPGTITEGTAYDFLVKEKLNPDEWEVSSFRRSEWQSPNGEVLESTRFSFVKKAAEGSSAYLPDLSDIEKAAKKSVVKRPKSTNSSVSLVTCLADAQIGKVDLRGGIEGIFVGMESAKATWVENVKAVKPEEIILVDLGDSVEGFECVPSEDRLNDLSLTEQIRVWRRIFWSWIDTAASLAPTVKVISVPSNHASVRRGRAKMGLPDDDFGIEVLAQVSDIAAVHPEKYGHVSFLSPNDFEESIVIKAVGGLHIGAVHGHQLKSPNGIEDWLAKQHLGENPMSFADIALFGHYHHLKIGEVGRGKTYMIAPASDPGSSWYSNNSGNYSKPGVLTFTVDENGWSNLNIC